MSEITLMLQSIDRGESEATEELFLRTTTLAMGAMGIMGLIASRKMLRRK
jgi:hypothetical protein